MEFKIPELGEGVHEGELVKWRVKPGDSVAHDQPLCEIMTDKATIEVPSPMEGRVSEVLAKEGQTVHVGQTILKMETKGAAAPEAKPAGAKPAAAAPVSVKAPVSGTPPAAPAAAFAAPSTRRLAREAGVDLNTVTGSGPHGRILREDVERAARGAPAAAGQKPAPQRQAVPTRQPAPRQTAPGSRVEERIPFHGLRKRIAEKMRLSKDRAAHFTYVEEADATELVRLRAQAKEMGAKKGVKVTYLPFIMKAMVAALKQYPILNASLDEATAEIIQKHYYNIGLSIQTDDGLTAPVVKDVDQKTIWELATEIEALVTRARNRQLQLEDFQGGTITLTNAGSIGGLFATPVINYPEVAILGFNKIFRKPVVKTMNGKEEIVIRDWTYFSISLDHRVVDGAVGAEFMKLFIQYIETPSLLVLG